MPVEAKLNPVDKIDVKIIAFIQDYPSASLKKIASHVRLTSTPVWKRIKKLERDKVIQRTILSNNERHALLHLLQMADDTLDEKAGVPAGTLNAFQKRLKRYGE